MLDLPFQTLYFQWYAITKVKEDGQWPGSLANHLGFEIHNQLNMHLNLQAGDLLLLAAGEHTPTVGIWLIRSIYYENWAEMW